MARAQPTFFWRYILLELWRLIALSTFVLVAVIAFAAAVKPLADGKLTPLEALRFMGLAVVPMLQYALPFAAGFAATLAYHRLSHDNELLAAYAGGISHRSVLAPAAITGLILSGVLFVLLEFAIPRFLQNMERLITLDVAKMLVNNVEHGQAVDIKGRQIYADRATRLTPAPGSGARDELALWGVVAVQLDKQGHVVSYVTAASGQAWFFPGERASDAADEGRSGLVVIRLRDALLLEPGKSLVFAKEWSQGISTPPGLSDNPKFLTYGELRELERRPELMDWIEQRRFDLAVHLGERVTTRTLDRELRDRGYITLTDDDARRWVLHGSGIQFSGQKDLRWNVLPITPGVPVELELTREPAPGESPGPVTHITARSVGLFTHIGGKDRSERRLTIRLEAEGVTSTGILPGTQAEPGGERSRRVMKGLTPVPDPIARLADPDASPPAELLEQARLAMSGPNPDMFVAGPAAELEREIKMLHNEVMSKQHERFAASAACAVMVVSGAVTAVSLSQSLPLTVYLWSFFPALATIILISSGQQLAHDKGVPGLLVLWGGVAVLGVYALIGYWRLARH